MESFPVHQLFSGKDHAYVYSLYRPGPPEELVKEILNYIREKYDGDLENAVDVGCGTGQCTIILSKLFKHVLAVDVSEAQIDEAIKLNNASNIEYRVQAAEVLPVRDDSVQLVNAGTCLHYFELEKFFCEVQRILAPGGVLAAYCHKFIKPLTTDEQKNRDIDSVIDKLYFVDLKDYWSPRSTLAFEEYRTVTFPFHDVKRIERMLDTFPGKLSDLMGYLKTLSGYQRFLSEHGVEKAEGLLSEVQARLCQILELQQGEEASVDLTLYRDYFVVLCRKKGSKAYKKM